MMHGDGDTDNFHLKIPQVYANTGGTTVLCVSRKRRQSGYKDKDGLKNWLYAFEFLPF